MKKYIDAEKLKAKIEKRKNILDVESPFGIGGRVELELVLDTITSLQQEQPKVDLVAELERHFATTPKEQLEKEWKELEHWNNVGPTVQEFLYGKQAEADLEEYIENEVKHYGLSLYEASYGTFSASQIGRIIRNAFEFGLNARKEE